MSKICCAHGRQTYSEPVFTGIRGLNSILEGTDFHLI